MGTDFPAGIDDFGIVVEHELVRESHMNDLRSAIEAVEAQVGVTDSAVADSLMYKIDKQQFITVAKKGGHYTSVQDAIDSITDSSADKRYLICVYPGNYEGNIDFTGHPCVSLCGVADQRSPVRLEGTTGVLVTFEVGCFSSINNISLFTSGSRIIYVPTGALVSDNIRLTNCNMHMTATTTANTVVELMSGHLECFHCNFRYIQTGNTTGACNHRAVHINGITASLSLHGCKVRMSVNDDNSSAVIVAVSEVSGIGTDFEVFIETSEVHVSSTSATWNGIAGFYFSDGGGATKIVQACHIHLSVTTGSIGYCYWQNDANSIIHSTGNRVIIEGFALNLFALNVATNEFYSHFDDVTAEGAIDIVGAGSTAEYVYSPDDGILHISKFVNLKPMAAAPAAPVNGDVYVNSGDNHMYCRLGGVWKQLDT